MYVFNILVLSKRPQRVGCMQAECLESMREALRDAQSAAECSPNFPHASISRYTHSLRFKFRGRCEINSFSGSFLFLLVLCIVRKFIVREVEVHIVGFLK